MVGHERQWREDQSLSKGVHLKMWGDDVDFTTHLIGIMVVANHYGLWDVQNFQQKLKA